jgi:hypothetical protein
MLHAHAVRPVVAGIGAKAARAERDGIGPGKIRDAAGFVQRHTAPEPGSSP